MCGRTPNLATVASVRLARDPLPAHMISYRPDGKRVLDYLICYQCGFVLRHFAAPPEARGDARSTVAGEAAVHELVRDLAGPEAAAQAELTHLYLGGLITHVRSIPVGLRVAAWLAEHYPVLREQQEEAVLRELAEAQVSLEPRIQRGHTGGGVPADASDQCGVCAVLGGAVGAAGVGGALPVCRARCRRRGAAEALARSAGRAGV